MPAAARLSCFFPGFLPFCGGEGCLWAAFCVSELPLGFPACVLLGAYEELEELGRANFCDGAPLVATCFVECTMCGYLL